MVVRKDIDNFIKTIPADVHLVAVTKYVDTCVMTEFLNHQIFAFGERKVDELLLKKRLLNDERVVWHFIGHLQTNKVKNVVNEIDYLHSLDSIKLAKTLSKYRKGKKLKCFIEVSINNEESKFGLKIDEVENFIKEAITLPNLKIIGFMMMSKKDSTHQSLLEQFQKLKELKENVNKKFNLNLQELSMGMSGDYKEAIQEGATYIRLGTILYE